MKNYVKGKDGESRNFPLSFFDYEKDERIDFTLTDQEIFSVSIDTDNSGRVLSLTFDRQESVHVTPKQIVLPRNNRRGKSLEKCLERNSKRFVCWNVGDLLDRENLTSDLWITLMPSWVHYTQPVKRRYLLRWNSDATVRAIESIDAEGKSQVVKSFVLSASYGARFLGAELFGANDFLPESTK